MASGEHMVKSPGFQPNFTASHAVVLDHPLSVTFPLLAHGDAMGPSVRLSDQVARFDLLKSDTIAIPSSFPLPKASVRALPSSVIAVEGERLLPRQFFYLEESVSAESTAKINGTLTWDDDAKVALYESFVESAEIWIWKLREFDEFEEGRMKKTKVKETIQGRAPEWLRDYVEGSARKAHTSHMEKYHLLFK